MTTEDVSKVYKVPVATIYKWRGEGKGPRALKVGKHLRFRPEDVEAYLDEMAETD
jgi:excisionase family DNA binding protein